ncbi:MAG: prolipoprotein diacylglyceryl transferase [Clostridia bacterium]|nr:prolipoprotein diacylglyceryl transferase [Clostridia bacterium]
MNPYIVAFGMGWYEICLSLSLVIAVFVADKLTIKCGFSVKLQRLFLVGAVLSVAIGFVGASLFQAFYDFMATGVFKIDETTGITFYGGFIVGAAVFLCVWFFGGKAFKISAETKEKIGSMADIAACVVPLAHAIGRIGCFMVGCCHGKQTNAWYGVNMLTENGWQTVVPLQLYEAIFLFLLSGVCFWLLFARKTEQRIPLLPIYGVSYGVWRFIIEYARGDERGQTIVSFLSPSQLIAVLLIVASIVYFCVWYQKKKKK